MLFAGEKPGTGLYKCKNCGQHMMIEGENGVVLCCSQCYYDEFEKL